jgi:hypothetical protein
MTTSDERSRLTEPLESVTAVFGGLMILAALVGVAFLVFGSGTFGGLSSSVCVTQPGAQYGASDWNVPFVAARPGNSVSIIGAVQACADHATVGEQALSIVAGLSAVVFWGSLLFLLWRMIVTARRQVVVHIVPWISASMAAPTLMIRAKVSSAAPVSKATGMCNGTSSRFANG